VKDLVEKFGADVNTPVGYALENVGMQQISPIVFGARTGDAQIFNYLLMKGAKLTVRSGMEARKED